MQSSNRPIPAGQPLCIPNNLEEIQLSAGGASLLGGSSVAH